MNVKSKPSGIQKKNVCIIIINWNNSLDTMNCLSSILSANLYDCNLTITCIDNGSTDNSVEKIKTWTEGHFSYQLASDQIQFFLLRNTRNLGYAKANNIAIEYAESKCDYDYFWLLNNDTVLEKCSLYHLLEYVKNINYRDLILGSTIVDYDEPNKIQCTGGFRYYPLLSITKKVFSGFKIKDFDRRITSPKLDCISGASMFISAKLLHQVGLLNTEYFLFYEELDYALRAKRLGYNIAWCKRSIIRHKEGASTGKRSANSRAGSWLANYHENLSTLKFTARYYPYLLLPAALLRLLIKVAISIIFFRWASLPPLATAYWDFLSGNSTRSAQYSNYKMEMILSALLHSTNKKAD